jgi:hypothetical protein
MGSLRECVFKIAGISFLYGRFFNNSGAVISRAFPFVAGLYQSILGAGLGDSESA